MPETSDETPLLLLRAIAAQDRAALADFYDLAGGVLFATALKMLGDTHEAEEVVQDVFVQIWTKAATFDAALGSPFSKGARFMPSTPFWPGRWERTPRMFRIVG